MSTAVTGTIENDGATASATGGSRRVGLGLAMSRSLEGVLRRGGHTVRLLGRRSPRPTGGSRSAHLAAPWLAYLAPVAALAVTPVGPGHAVALVPASMLVALVALLLACAAPALAGLASSRAGARLGALRAADQTLAAAPALVLTVIGCALLYGTLSFDDAARGAHWWTPLALLPAGVVMLVAGMVALHLPPFDAPRAGELGGGPSGSVSGAALAGLGIGRVLAVLALAVLVASTALAGWAGPAAGWLGPFWLLLKTAVVLGALLALGRASTALPATAATRLAWLVLTPAAGLLLVLTALGVTFA